MTTTSNYTKLENKRKELLDRGFMVSNIKLTENQCYRMFEARSDEGVDYEIIEDSHGDLDIYRDGCIRVFL